MDSRVAIYVAIYQSNITWCQKYSSRLPFEILLLLNRACNMSTSTRNVSTSSSSSLPSVIPPPTLLKLGSDVAADWERFRSEWENYEIAKDLESANGKKRAAVLLACIGSAGTQRVSVVQVSER